MLKDLFGKAPRTDTQPDEAVAMGAAIHAARKAADENRVTVDTEGKKVLPPAAKMVDVNSHPLGCLALHNGVECNCVIIPANTPLPAEKEELFSLVQENQTEARIAVAQGPDKALPADCTLIGEMILGGLPPGDKDDRVAVKYGLTAEGTLTINGTDTLSGKTTSDVKRDLVDLIKRINQS
jgi:molecular chaperone DnaK (HSP70)